MKPRAPGAFACGPASKPPPGSGRCASAGPDIPSQPPPPSPRGGCTFSHQDNGHGRHAPSGDRGRRHGRLDDSRLAGPDPALGQLVDHPRRIARNRHHRRGRRQLPTLRGTIARLGHGLPGGDERSFMRAARATFKQGVRFVGWAGQPTPARTPTITSTPSTCPAMPSTNACSPSGWTAASIRAARHGPDH
jgi:hypothetical protein